MLRNLEHDKWITTADQFADVRIAVDNLTLLDGLTQVEISSQPPLRYGFLWPVRDDNVELLRKGNSLGVRIADKTWAIELTGASAAIDAVRTCAMWIEEQPVEVAPEVLRVLATHPLFASAPKVLAGLSYQSASVSSSWGGGASSKTESQSSASVRWARDGLTVMDERENTNTSAGGKSFAGMSEKRSMYAANGFIELGNANTFKSPDMNSQQTVKLVKLENLSGQIYPLKVGGQFSYSAVYEEAVDGTANGLKHRATQQRTLRQTCKIAKKQEARDFHPSLSGEAFVADCESRVVYRGQTPWTSKSREVFIEALGLWISADWQYSDGRSTTKLKSFVLGR
jgi:hypothetical protein